LLIFIIVNFIFRISDFSGSIVRMFRFVNDLSLQVYFNYRDLLIDEVEILEIGKEKNYLMSTCNRVVARKKERAKQ
jgi:hypothetical protein